MQGACIGRQGYPRLGPKMGGTHLHLAVCIYCQAFPIMQGVESSVSSKDIWAPDTDHTTAVPGRLPWGTPGLREQGTLSVTDSERRRAPRTVLGVLRFTSSILGLRCCLPLPFSMTSAKATGRSDPGRSRGEQPPLTARGPPYDTQG